MSALLLPGEKAPWFKAEVLGDSEYALDTAAGRWTVLLFMGSGAHPHSQHAFRLIESNRALFDDKRASFLGITIDPTDASDGRILPQASGTRWVLDYNRQLSARYGATDGESGNSSYKPHWLLLDPMLHVRSGAAFGNGSAIFDELRHCLGETTDQQPFAPVLVVPGVLSPDLCRSLIELYRNEGGNDSGFMKEVNGLTLALCDHDFKRRSDIVIKDEPILATLKGRIATVLKPVMQHAFQFEATRIERFIVACYDGQVGGHFGRHRDNTTKGTAHRKFACTINLNSDFDGGELCFPEFGERTYRAPPGGAIIFSCSLLHEALPVTRGERFAFLPFLYDEAGARVRENNLDFVGQDLKDYKSGLPPEDAGTG
jgi:peroxiredoxin